MVSLEDVVHPTWSVYESTSSESFFALKPSLILILRPFFSPTGGCPGLPFFGWGLLPLFLLGLPFGFLFGTPGKGN